PTSYAYWDYITGNQQISSGDEQNGRRFPVYIFVAQDGQWKLDGLTWGCSGNCADAPDDILGGHFFTNEVNAPTSATATAEARIAPVDASTCTLPTTVSSDAPATPTDRGYVPIVRLDAARASYLTMAGEVTRAANNVVACAELNPDSLTGLETTRLSAESALTGGTPVLTDIQVSEAQSLSFWAHSLSLYVQPAGDAFGSPANATSPTVWPLSISGDPVDRSSGWWTKALSSGAAMLPDGRIGVSLTYFTASDNAWQQQTDAAYEVVPFLIFSQENSSLKLDEVLPLCFGQCDAFWQGLSSGSTLVPASPAPVATPVAIDESRRAFWI
ncbi:MAG TPA: hypothetical protein VFQ54_11360, partial [Thermomicrobiales bacterium]|nr:hypothetical protein [Thermomicrobiales bacterium]